MQKQQFGMMDEGYFVPKSQILAWINDLLKINISKIQALGSGAIYCQIFDVIHPGKLNVHKVNWKAKNDNEFLPNFRLLQSAFEKAGIKRHIEVEKLVKAKYQDNLEFIQWFKRYFDLNCGSKGEGYDAVEKRNKIVPDFGFAQKTIVPKVYSGAGQVQAKQKEVKQKEVKQPVQEKKQQPVKQQKPVEQKTQRKVPAKVSKPSTVSHPTRVKTDVHEKKQEVKKVEVKKQQPVKKVQIPKKEAPVKKQPTVHQPAVKKTVQPTAVKNNLSGVHNNVVQTAGKKPKEVVKHDDQKVKQLQHQLESIKTIVGSDKECEDIVAELRVMLNINKSEEKKVQQQKNISPKKQQTKEQQVTGQQVIGQQVTAQQVPVVEESDKTVKQATQVVEENQDEDLLASQHQQQQEKELLLEQQQQQKVQQPHKEAVEQVAVQEKHEETAVEPVETADLVSQSNQLQHQHEEHQAKQGEEQNSDDVI